LKTKPIFGIGFTTRPPAFMVIVIFGEMNNWLLGDFLALAECNK
jgi:hypothetical protein